MDKCDAVSCRSVLLPIELKFPEFDNRANASGIGFAYGEEPSHRTYNDTKLVWETCWPAKTSCVASTFGIPARCRPDRLLEHRKYYLLHLTFLMSNNIIFWFEEDKQLGSVDLYWDLGVLG